MPDDLIRFPSVADQVRAFADGAYAPATRRAYAVAWRAFEQWCKARGLSELPASSPTVAGFLANCAASRPEGLGLGLSAIEHRHAAIKLAHRLRQLEDPTKDVLVETTYEGIRRQLGTRPERRVAAMRLDVIGKAVAALDLNSTRGKLEAAILLVGHAGAFRRSEIRALDLSDVRPEQWGCSLLLRRSKTDQAGEGEWKAIVAATSGPCPVAALHTWLRVRGDVPGPLFKAVGPSGAIWPTRVKTKTIANMVKRAAKAAGLRLDVSGHSLRAGFITDADAAGASPIEIARQSGHKDLNQLSKYIREIDPLRGNAVTRVYGPKKEA